MTDLCFVFKDVQDEVTLARLSHERPFSSPHEGYAIILEEIDELKAEIWRKDRDKVRMRKEAIQVAAMAVRFVADLL